MKSDSLLTTHYSLVIILACTLLISCTASTAVNQAKKTASGVINPIVDTAKDVQKRVKQVQSGVTLIQNGIESVKGSIQ